MPKRKFTGKQLGKQSFEKSDKLLCQICSKVGHTAMNCFQLRDILLGKSTKAQRNSTSTLIAQVTGDKDMDTS